MLPLLSSAFFCLRFKLLRVLDCLAKRSCNCTLSLISMADCN